MKLIRDNLIIDNKIQDPKFECNPIKPQASSLDSNDIQWSTTDEQVVDKSTFWGYARSIKCIEDAQEGLANILQDESNADASHIVYAYRFTDSESLQITTGNSDSGEIGASKHLLNQLVLQNASALVVVLRKFGGVHLGKKRWRLYTDHAKSAINQLAKT